MVKDQDNRRRLHRKVTPTTQVTSMSTVRFESSVDFRKADDFEETSNIKSEDLRVTISRRDLERHHKHRIKQLDGGLALAALLSIIFATYSENYFFNNDYRPDHVVNALRSFVSILTSFLILLIFYRTLLCLKLMRAKGQCDAMGSLFSTGLYKQLILELLVFGVHCPPGLNSTFKTSVMCYTIEYSWDTVLTFVVLLRSYLIMRMLFTNSIYYTARAEWVLKAHNLNLSTSFAVKAYIQSRPMLTVSVVFILASVFWAELLLLAEKPDREMECKSRETGTVESDLDTFWQCFWLTFVTTSTVGYGDMYPYTHVGRAIAMLACILGNVYTGLLVLALQNNLEMSDDQSRAIRYSFQRQNSAMLYNSACQSIKQFMVLKAKHKSFKQKYRRAFMLTSFRINSNVKKAKRSSLLPLTKVYGRWNQVARDIVVLGQQDYLSKKKDVILLKKHLSIIKGCTRNATKPGSTWQIMIMMKEGWDIELKFLSRFTRKVCRTKGHMKPIISAAASIQTKAQKLRALTAYLCDSILVKERINSTRFQKVFKTKSSLKDRSFMRRRSYINTLSSQSPTPSQVLTNFYSLGDIGTANPLTSTPSADFNLVSSPVVLD